MPMTIMGNQKLTIVFNISSPGMIASKFSVLHKSKLIPCDGAELPFVGIWDRCINSCMNAGEHVRVPMNHATKIMTPADLRRRLI